MSYVGRASASWLQQTGTSRGRTLRFRPRRPSSSLSLANPAFRPTVEAALIGSPAAVLLVEFAGEDDQSVRAQLKDLVALMGNYAATAAMLTAFDMQLDPDQPPPFHDPS